MLVALACLAGVVLSLGAYSWFEAGWLRMRVVEVSLPGLPSSLDGVRVGHLSDSPWER